MGAKFTSALILAFALGSPTACNPVAVLHYSQLGACTKAVTPTGEQDAPPNYAFVIFRVTSIDNSKVNSSWSLDPNLFVVEPPSLPQSNLGGMGPVTVPANAVVPVNVLVGIQVHTSNVDGSDAAATNYFILYQSPAAGSSGNPGTLGAKDNSNQVTYPFVQQCTDLLK